MSEPGLAMYNTYALAQLILNFDGIFATVLIMTEVDNLHAKLNG
jgi:hypothetical protein